MHKRLEAAVKEYPDLQRFVEVWLPTMEHLVTLWDVKFGTYWDENYLGLRFIHENQVLDYAFEGETWQGWEMSYYVYNRDTEKITAEDVFYLRQQHE